ncbi:MAG: hypothetical protein AAF939_11410, partial [Planctomycetota bacterium]
MDQPSLFNVQPQPWQLDDQDDWLAARVVFAATPYGPYDYSIPSELEKSVKKGVRVEVPLGRGNRKMTGYCVDIIGPFHPLAASVNLSRLKPILRVLDPKPLTNDKLLALGQWISDYYLCPLGQVIETIVPTGVRNQSGTREMLFLSLPEDFSIRLASTRISKLQKRILQTMQETVQDWTPRELAETIGCTQGPITALRKKELIVTSSKRVQQKTHEIPNEKRESDLKLNSEQQVALDRIHH